MTTHANSFRNHMFSVGPTELELHENLMPCLIYGLGNPVFVGNDQECVEADVVFIKPNAPHQVSIRDGGADIIYLDGLVPSEKAPAFQSLTHDFNSLPEAMRRRDPESVYQVRSKLDSRNLNPDPEILKIVQCLYKVHIHRMSQETLSQRLGLERTQALRHFKANTGQTFRKFKIWAAAVSTIHGIFNGGSIGASGVDAGFSDAAHVARTSRTIFGMTPTEGLQNLSSSISI